MTDQYKALRDALAAGPLEGPWAFAPYTKSSFGLGTRGDCATYLVKCQYGDTRDEKCIADVRYIAAANPETVAKLLAERDALAESISKTEGEKS
ncbi:hypothetical protein [Pusillimonas minor]|uniref:Uncharacterized protein n=1 Tax=Pusillimonas minor TaxID=2697024 RepID=A0A842HK36_9BURK|nr:hypothetical protein [Pusillimonas minor]MBC2768593.1 hypothetical protein [Pusillimonas minor]